MKERKPKQKKPNKVLLGVLGGVAEHFNINPWLVRLAYILFFLGFSVVLSSYGIGLILAFAAYFIGYAVLQKKL